MEVKRELSQRRIVAKSYVCHTHEIVQLTGDHLHHGGGFEFGLGGGGATEHSVFPSRLQ